MAMIPCGGANRSLNLIMNCHLLSAALHAEKERKLPGRIRNIPLLEFVASFGRRDP
ncbi:hypothetical protein BAXH7_02641 [Bacillus amyloliquefaciens XH7]|nr:hypothetical protein BAXH7_02641 [Bacillus amyloliquefaciens XH7]